MITILVILGPVMSIAGIVLGGFIGMNLERRRGMAQMAAQPPAYLCACGHSLAEHTNRDHSGPCNKKVQQPHFAGLKEYPFRPGDRNGYEYIPCACTGYIGDLPLTLTEIQKLFNN